MWFIVGLLIAVAIYLAVALATTEVILKETEHSDFNTTLLIGLGWPITFLTFFFKKIMTAVYRKIK